MSLNRDEFMLTLPSNSSVKYYPENKPSTYKVLLPAPLELEGEWEAGIISIQYPFNWPNFNGADIAVIASMKDLEEPKVGSFRAQCNLARVQFLYDKEMKDLKKLAEEYMEANKDIGNPTDFKVFKLPTGYFDSPAKFAEYFAEQFNYAFQPTGFDIQMPCKLKAIYDPVTHRVHFDYENLIWVRIATKSKEVHSILGTDPDFWENKLYVATPSKFHGNRAMLQTFSTMYIYCDAIKYQVVGDTQAPLLATLAVQGSYGAQCFWPFNPPYYIPVNQKTISTLELRICTDTGEIFPFHPSGRVVIQLHFRRQKSPW